MLLIIVFVHVVFLQFVYNFKVLDFCRLYSDVHSPTITNFKFKLAVGNDQSTSELCNLLIDSAKTTFGTHKYKTRPDTCNKKPKGDKPWFNYECKAARQNIVN